MSLDDVLGQKKPEFIVIKNNENDLAIINLNDFSMLQATKSKEGNGSIQRKQYYNIPVRKEDKIFPAGKGFVVRLLLKFFEEGEK